MKLHTEVILSTKSKVMTTCRVDRAREILKKKSNDAVYQACARGQIPHRKWGKAILFFEEELFELIDSQPGVRIEDIR